MSSVVKKEDAHDLVERLPPDATWEDLMYEIYVREVIERGLDDSNRDRVRNVREVREKYGLPE